MKPYAGALITYQVSFEEQQPYGQAYLLLIGLNMEHAWPLNAPKENSTSLAQLICQSLAYIREFSSTPMEGSQNVLYPLWVVSRYYARNVGCERELLWCQQLCHLVAADGFQIAESLTTSDPWTPRYLRDENEGCI